MHEAYIFILFLFLWLPSIVRAYPAHLPLAEQLRFHPQAAEQWRMINANAFSISDHLYATLWKDMPQLPAIILRLNQAQVGTFNQRFFAAEPSSPHWSKKVSCSMASSGTYPH